MLSAAQQDYLEVIYRLESEQGTAGVRITDIANELGTRMPTVTRTVKRIVGKGYLQHTRGGTVELTKEGRRLAREILHLHEDLVRFLNEVLGVERDIAMADACKIEHGCSSETAQRLHEFLEYYDRLPDKDRSILTDFASETGKQEIKFKYLPGKKIHGWRT